MAQPYQLTIGEFTCHVIRDGARQMETAALADRLPTADPQTLQALAARRHPAGTLEWAFNPLLIQTPGDVILVDTGFGATPQQVAGLVDPADVSRLIITHSHGDHVNGAVDGDGNLHYPNAEIVMQTVEWEFWNSSDLRETFWPRLVCLDGEVEIAPGLTFIPAPGHTPGHSALLVESKGERLLHLVDTLHAPVQLDHPEWSVAFDSDMDLAAETRRAMLGRAADEGMLTLLYHFAFPGLGHVTRAGQAFDWRPV